MIFRNFFLGGGGQRSQTSLSPAPIAPSFSDCQKLRRRKTGNFESPSSSQLTQLSMGAKGRKGKMVMHTKAHIFFLRPPDISICSAWEKRGERRGGG